MEDLLEGRRRDIMTTGGQYDAFPGEGITAHREKIYGQSLAAQDKVLGE
jgi:hypothetical protein